VGDHRIGAHVARTVSMESPGSYFGPFGGHEAVLRSWMPNEWPVFLGSRGDREEGRASARRSNVHVS